MPAALRRRHGFRERQDSLAARHGPWLPAWSTVRPATGKRGDPATKTRWPPCGCCKSRTESGQPQASGRDTALADPLIGVPQRGTRHTRCQVIPYRYAARVRHEYRSFTGKQLAMALIAMTLRSRCLAELGFDDRRDRVFVRYLAPNHAEIATVTSRSEMAPLEFDVVAS